MPSVAQDGDHPLRHAGRLEVREPSDKFAEQRCGLEPCEGGPDAHVGTKTEGGLLASRSGDIEHVRVVEHLLISVARFVREVDALTGREIATAQRRRRRYGPHESTGGS